MSTWPPQSSVEQAPAPRRYAPAGLAVAWCLGLGLLFALPLPVLADLAEQECRQLGDCLGNAVAPFAYGLIAVPVLLLAVLVLVRVQRGWVIALLTPVAGLAWFFVGGGTVSQLGGNTVAGLWLILLGPLATLTAFAVAGSHDWGGHLRFGALLVPTVLVGVLLLAGSLLQTKREADQIAAIVPQAYAPASGVEFAYVSDDHVVVEPSGANSRWTLLLMRPVADPCVDLPERLGYQLGEEFGSRCRADASGGFLAGGEQSSAGLVRDGTLLVAVADYGNPAATDPTRLLEELRQATPVTAGELARS